MPETIITLDARWLEHSRVLDAIARLRTRYARGRVLSLLVDAHVWLATHNTDVLPPDPRAYARGDAVRAPAAALVDAGVLVHVPTGVAFSADFRAESEMNQKRIKIDSNPAEMNQKRIKIDSWPEHTRDGTERLEAISPDIATTSAGQNTAGLTASRSVSTIPRTTFDTERQKNTGTTAVLGTSTAVLGTAGTGLRAVGDFLHLYRWTLYPELQGVAYTPSALTEQRDLDAATRLLAAYPTDAEAIARVFLAIPDERDPFLAGHQRTVTMLLSRAGTIAQRLRA